MKIFISGKRFKFTILYVSVALFLFSLSGGLWAQELRRISMDFQEAALKDVLKVFSQQAGLNFVATENIENRKITLYLDGVTVQDALDSIIKANNLAYDQPPGSSIFVVMESKEPAVKLITKVYKLKFARVEGIGGSEGSSEQRMTGQTIDIKSVLENVLTKAKDGKQYGSIVVDKRTNSIIITSIPEDFPLIEKTLEKLDAFSPQALIEVEMVEINTTAVENLGLEWGNQASGTFVSFTGPTLRTHFPFIRESGPLSKSLLKNSVAVPGSYGTLSLADFSIVIKALESEGMAKYLAKPRIMVLNNETAEIKISADTAIGVKSTTISDTGEIQQEAERQETGILLKVTPTINQDDYITMTLEPEVSRAIRSQYFSQYLDPSKRSAKTTVMIKGGQTIAIGGLIRADKDDSTSAVPGLRRIPLLGRMFKKDSTRKEETELIIFITAHVIKDVTGISADINNAKEEKGAGLSKEALAVNDKERQVADKRESEIRKTVVKLRKKRELSDSK